MQLPSESVQGPQNQHATVTILNICRMHDGLQQQAYRIDKNMAPLAIDFLPGIVSIGIDAGRPLVRSPRPEGGSSRRTSTSRRRPPRLAGGRRGSTQDHFSSVRSLG